MSHSRDPLRIVFLGSGPFAVPLVDRLAELCAPGAPQELALVVTRPDRRAGRGRKTRTTPVRQRCEELALALEAPESANGPKTIDRLTGLAPDLVFVADYGEFLGKALRDLPRIGTYNFHGSLLPRHRGAAPVAHALLAGDAETGVTLFRLVRAMDAGPIVHQVAAKILPQETAGELEARLAVLAAELLEKSLPGFMTGAIDEVAQDDGAATEAPKLSKEMGAVTWDLPAEQVSNHIRAMNPWPGAHSTFVAADPAPHTPERLDFRIFRCRPVPSGSVAGDWRPGQVTGVTDDGITVRCAADDLELLELQRPGKARMPAGAVLRGFPMHPGDRFESPPGT